MISTEDLVGSYVVVTPAPFTPECAVPIITSDPSDQTVSAGTNASFSATATGSTPLQYQWQVDDGAGNFSNLSDGPIYSGAQTSTLLIQGTPAELNGRLYRVRVSNRCFSDVASNPAQLTVLFNQELLNKMPGEPAVYSNSQYSVITTRVTSCLAYASDTFITGHSEQPNIRPVSASWDASIGKLTTVMNGVFNGSETQLQTAAPVFVKALASSLSFTMTNVKDNSNVFYFSTSNRVFVYNLSGNLLQNVTQSVQSDSWVGTITGLTPGTTYVILLNGRYNVNQHLGSITQTMQWGGTGQMEPVFVEFNTSSFGIVSCI